MPTAKKQSRPYRAAIAAAAITLAGVGALVAYKAAPPAVTTTTTKSLPAGAWVGPCVKVPDGDTIHVLKDGLTRQVVRVAKIDCPERLQPRGEDARKFTERFCLNKKVTVIPWRLDRYRRTVGEVRVDGKDLGAELILAGWAWHYRAFSSDAAFDVAEKRAREKKRGLWVDTKPKPVAPWDWRQEQKAK